MDEDEEDTSLEENGVEGESKMPARKRERVKMAMKNGLTETAIISFDKEDIRFRI